MWCLRLVSTYKSSSKNFLALLQNTRNRQGPSRAPVPVPIISLASFRAAQFPMRFLWIALFAYSIPEILAHGNKAFVYSDIHSASPWKVVLSAKPVEETDESTRSANRVGIHGYTCIIPRKKLKTSVRDPTVDFLSLEEMLVKLDSVMANKCYKFAQGFWKYVLFPILTHVKIRILLWKTCSTIL